jgi:nucleotide-binding universal stress UspA family protein
MLEIPVQETDAVNAYSEIPEVLFFIKMAHQKFEHIMNSDYLEGITVHEIVKPNGSFNDISNMCKEYDITLITMRSHGASRLKEIFVGSNAEKAVHHSEVPVLVIKSNHDNFSINNIVFASDFKNDNKQTYHQATEFANAFNAKIHLHLVITPNNFKTTQKATDSINNFICDHNFEDFTLNIYKHDTVEKGILNFSKHIDADVIGISTHGRQGIAPFFYGSISEDLVNHAQRPVISSKI